MALAAAGVVAGLLMVEGALRIVTNTGFPSGGSFLGASIVLDPVLAWRNVPGRWPARRWVNGRWSDTIVEIDDSGFRGPAFSHEKPEGVTRIVTMGDSGTYGTMSFPSDDESGERQWWAIPSYVDVLRERFQREGRGDVEVINGGVIGYTSGHGLRQLALSIVDLEPDIVTLRFGANDARSSWAPERRAGLPDSDSAQALLKFFHKWRIVRVGMRAHQSLPALHPAPDTVPWSSLSEFRENLVEMDSIGREHGIRVILLDYPIAPNHWSGPKFAPYQQALSDVARSHAIPLLETASVMLETPQLSFATHDSVHPNVFGARLIADLLFERLSQLGWLDPRS